MKRGIQSCLCLLATTGQTVFCQGTIYTSRSAFESALGSSTTITFEDVPVTRPPGGLGESIITASGVSFTHPGGLLFVRDSFSPIPATGKYLQLLDGIQPISISLPSGVTAFGANFTGGWESGSSFTARLTVNLAGGSSQAYNFPGMYNQWTFFGVTFEQPIASLTYSDGGNPPLFLHGEMLDNVTFGVIPEPSMLGLFACGCAVVGWRLFRKPRS